MQLRHVLSYLENKPGKIIIYLDNNKFIEVDENNLEDYLDKSVCHIMETISTNFIPKHGILNPGELIKIFEKRIIKITLYDEEQEDLFGGIFNREEENKC